MVSKLYGYRLWIALLTAAALISLTVFTYHTVYESKTDEGGINDENLLIVAKGEQHTIYATNETYQEMKKTGKEGTPFYTLETLPEINETDALALARKFIKDPVERRNTYAYEFSERNEPKIRVVIGKDRGVTYIDERYLGSTIQADQALSREELINRSKEIVLSLRGSVKDLVVEVVQSPKIVEVNGGSGEESVAGFSDQLVKFRQMVNGVPVYGAHGYIIVSLGPGGILTFYDDQTVKYSKISTSGVVGSVESAVQYLANNGVPALRNNELILKEWSLVFFDGGVYPSQIGLYYRFLLESVNHKVSSQEFVLAFPYPE